MARGMPRWKQALPKRLLLKYEPVKKPGEGERLPDFVHATESDYFRLDVPKPGAYVKCVALAHERHVFDTSEPREDEYKVLLPIRCERCGIASKDAGPCFVGHAECVPVSWWYCDPLGHWGRLGADLPVLEHEDGTISVQGTIENVGPYEGAWCGTLERGVWTAIEAEEQMEL